MWELYGLKLSAFPEHVVWHDFCTMVLSFIGEATKADSKKANNFIFQEKYFLGIQNEQLFMT